MTRYTIIVPTYNEEKDIEETIKALLRLSYSDKEIIVVDDSTDSTPEIVRKYSEEGVKLIIPGKKDGRCGARNLGIMAASGDVVVILNADARLPRTFIEQIDVHYKKGADYVLVRSKVANENSIFARYIGADSDCLYYTGNNMWMEWTEGFSVRKDVAMKSSLFPTGFPVPLVAGEDGEFGARIRALGARKVIDLDILVYHVAPGDLAEFWYSRVERGTGSPQVRYFLQNWHKGGIIAWALLRASKIAFYSITLLPAIYFSWRNIKCSPNKGGGERILFILCWYIEQAGFVWGEISSIFALRALPLRWKVGGL